MSITLNFTDNKAASAKFISIAVDIDKIIHSWQLSILAHEWLMPSGKPKPCAQLSEQNQQKLNDAIQTIKSEKAVTKPVLGLGILDNIEIGSGRAEFIALYNQDIKQIYVHIPKSNEADFKKYLK